MWETCRQGRLSETKFRLPLQNKNRLIYLNFEHNGTGSPDSIFSGSGGDNVGTPNYGASSGDGYGYYDDTVNSSYGNDNDRWWTVEES